MKTISANIAITSENGYGHVNIRFRVVDDNNLLAKMAGKLYLDRFEASCQIDASSTPAQPCYAQRVSYNNQFFIEESTCKAQYETFKIVRRKLDKLNAQFGYPRTYGEYAARLAKIVGATRFTLNGSEISLESFGQYVDREVANVGRKLNPNYDNK